uniref:Putative secreted protein n=1 Tax=Ixodes ricinus TaxID=34613 RepID=A0A6B0UQY1_IXORI
MLTSGGADGSEGRLGLLLLPLLSSLMKLLRAAVMPKVLGSRSRPFWMMRSTLFGRMSAQWVSAYFALLAPLMGRTLVMSPRLVRGLNRANAVLAKAMELTMMIPTENHWTYSGRFTMVLSILRVSPRAST